jgi:Heparinase II/III-like protein
MRRIVTVMAACALVLATGVGVPVATAQAAPPSTLAATPSAAFATPRAASCAHTLKNIELFRSTSSFDYPSTLTILNAPVGVDLDAFSIGDPKYTDPSQVLWYRSLLWLALGAVNAHEAGNDAQATVMARNMIRAAGAYPDPGSATPEALAISNAFGWDEGTAMRRAQALLCLATYTGSGPVDGLLRVHAAALMDPVRYMGPPNRPVHNHGLMSNITLLEIGELLGEPSYRQVALDRLRNDYKSAFDELGMNWEGSSHYHTVNIDFWADAVSEMADRGFTADAQALQAALNKAGSVAAHFISPTGVPLLVGNSRPDDGYARPGPDAGRPVQFVDTEAGVAFGRWSWTNTKTTYWSAFNRTRRGAHGHYDRTSVTWQTDGVPILTDVGQPDYDTIANPLTIWSRTPVAQNESVPKTVRDDGKKVALMTVKRAGDTDTITMASSQNGPLQIREAVVDNKRHQIQVSDHVPGGQAQHWHLSPEWAVQSIAGTTAKLAGPEGRVLTVQTSPGASITQLRGSLAPLGGWQVTGFKAQVPAVELIVTSSQSELTTSFALTKATSKVNDLQPVKLSPLSVPGRGQVKLDWSGATADSKAGKLSDPSASPTAPSGTTAKSLPSEPSGSPSASGSQSAEPTPAPTGLSAAGLAKKPVVKPSVKITGYRILARQNHGAWVTAIADTKSTAVRKIIRSLQNGDSYRFRIAALGKRVVGPLGPQSKRITPRTFPDAVTLPVIAKAKPKAKGGVRLSWGEPAFGGGARVTGYQVRVPGQGWVDRKPRFYEFLLPKKRLVVKVRAVNVAGEGKVLRIVLQGGKTPTVISPAPPVTPAPTPAPA